MRYLLGLVLLFSGLAAQAANIPAALLKELNRPAVDEHGCALPEKAGVRDGYEYDKDFDGEGGSLSNCGAYVRGDEEGYWVYERSGFYQQGWYRQGKRVGTWLAISPTGWLAAVYRYDEQGRSNGIRYGLGEHGQLIWRYMYVDDRLVIGCGGDWPAC